MQPGRFYKRYVLYPFLISVESSFEAFELPYSLTPVLLKVVVSCSETLVYTHHIFALELKQKWCVDHCMLKSEKHSQVLIPHPWCKLKRSCLIKFQLFKELFQFNIREKHWECQNSSWFVFKVLLTSAQEGCKRPTTCLFASTSEIQVLGMSFAWLLQHSFLFPLTPHTHSPFPCPVAQEKGWTRLTCQLYL